MGAFMCMYDVFFDNLQVIHTPGPILEETHYYPFGLVQSGISSKAAGSLENKKSKYNGYELNADLDINFYESFYRSHDPQLGRFWQVDPRPSDNSSLYSAMNNNPILINDILGDTGRIGTVTEDIVKVKGVEYKKEDIINSMVNDLNKITGLKLEVDKNGILVNNGIATNKGVSMSARNEVLNMINSDGNVYIDFSSISSKGLQMSDANTGSIMLNPADIAAQIAGASKDLNKITFGWGMTVLHELGHTYLHRNFGHSEATMTSFGVIDEADARTNQMRSELGSNWGQRLSYTSLPFGNVSYIPMTPASLKALQIAIPQIERAMNMNPLRQASAMQNIKMPTSGVIIINN